MSAAAGPSLRPPSPETFRAWLDGQLRECYLIDDYPEIRFEVV